MPRYSPLPTSDLNDCAAWPFGAGVKEVVIRVSRYEDDGTTPANFQVIVTGCDPNRGSIFSLANPVSALKWAIDMFFAPRGEARQEVKTDQDIEDLLA